MAPAWLALCQWGLAQMPRPSAAMVAAVGTVVVAAGTVAAGTAAAGMAEAGTTVAAGGAVAGCRPGAGVAAGEFRHAAHGPHCEAH
jgi:hypothetical protein